MVHKEKNIGEWTETRTASGEKLSSQMQGPSDRGGSEAHNIN